MPAAKPTKLPRWASGATALITEPNEGKKDVGHQVAERPPAQYFNWLFNLLYGWAAWLSDFEIVAHTWAALQTFAGGVAVTGSLSTTGDITSGEDIAADGNLTVGGQASINSMLTVTGEANISNRIRSGSPINGTDLKLVSEHPGYGPGAGAVRRYASGAGSTLRLVETVNASYEEGEWFRDVPTDPAYRTELSIYGEKLLLWYPGDASPFTRIADQGPGGLKWLGVGTESWAGNPPATTAISNELRAKNVCKAWGHMTNVGSTPTLADGVNIASVTNVLSGGVDCWRFAFPSGGGMADANYCVQITTGFNGTPDVLMRCKPVVVARATTYFDVTMFDPQTGGSGGNSGNIAIDVSVLGKQAS